MFRSGMKKIYQSGAALHEPKPDGLELSSSEQLQADMEDVWHIASSEKITCDECFHFETECSVNHAEMCPAVIKRFNLDGMTFQ